MNRNDQSLVIKQMADELKMRLVELPDELETIYLGGGTPSLLSEDQLATLMEPLSGLNSQVKEVTIEVNPEDVTANQLTVWKRLGISRLSLGVQSFHDRELTWMNRNHNSKTSQNALELIAEFDGFEWSADLIFGVPGSGLNELMANMERLLAFQPNHVSAYHLTLESNTPYQKLVNQGKYQKPQEANEQFVIISDFFQNEGFDHYEVSNFAKPGRYAVHNGNYWNRKPYLGIGPGAHSFKGNVRRWNVRNNQIYAHVDLSESHWYESEVLTAQDVFNEQILTGLRTKAGVDMKALNFDINEKDLATQLASDGLATIHDNQLVLTREGWLMADALSSELFRLQ